jgi:uncharacterized Rmd1/YagE family protein
VHVDEINIEKLGPKIKSKLASKPAADAAAAKSLDDGDVGGASEFGGDSSSGPWDVAEYYDSIRLWQVSPPYLGQEQVIDWPLSEDEDTAAEANGGDRAPSIDYEAARPEVFLFSFGAAVFWNFPSEEVEIRWLNEHVLEPFNEAVGDGLADEEVEAAKDEMAFVYGGVDNPFSLKRDVANLETRETGEKLAVSYALAKSSLLSVYEERVQKVCFTLPECFSRK